MKKIIYLGINFLPFLYSLSQNITQLDIDYGIANMKLGTSLDSIKQKYNLSNSSYEIGKSDSVLDNGFTNGAIVFSVFGCTNCEKKEEKAMVVDGNKFVEKMIEYPTIIDEVV